MKKHLETISLLFKTIALGVAAFAFAILLIQPSWVATHLERMEKGLEKTNHRMEFSFFGTKIYRNGIDAEDLKISEQRILELEALVACLNKDGVTCDTPQAETALQITEKETRILETAGREKDLPSSDSWMILAASFPTLEGAEKLRDRMTNSNVDIIYTQNRFRPIAIFSSRDAAETALPRIENTTGRDDAYIRSLGAWCKTYGISDNGKFIECTR